MWWWSLLLAVTLRLPVSARLACWSGRKPVNGETADIDHPELGASELVEVDSNGKRGCGKDVEGYVRCWADGTFWTLPKKAEHWHVGNELVCITLFTGGIECYNSKVDGVVLEQTIDPGEPVRAVASHFHFVCYLRDDDGGPACPNMDTMPEGSAWEYAMMESGFTKLVMGHFACMLDDAGRLICWRFVLNGLELPTMPSHVVDVDSFSGYTCWVTLQHEVDCWGGNAYSSDGSLNVENSMAPFTAVTVGSDIACGKTVGGDLVCWGQQDIRDNRPLGLNGILSMGAGGRSVCVISSDFTTTASSSTATSSTTSTLTLSTTTSFTSVTTTTTTRSLTSSSTPTTITTTATMTRSTTMTGSLTSTSTATETSTGSKTSSLTSSSSLTSTSSLTRTATSTVSTSRSLASMETATSTFLATTAAMSEAADGMFQAFGADTETSTTTHALSTGTGTATQVQTSSAAVTTSSSVALSMSPIEGETSTPTVLGALLGPTGTALSTSVTGSSGSPAGTSAVTGGAETTSVGATSSESSSTSSSSAMSVTTTTTTSTLSSSSGTLRARVAEPTSVGATSSSSLLSSSTSATTTTMSSSLRMRGSVAMSTSGPATLPETTTVGTSESAVATSSSAMTIITTRAAARDVEMEEAPAAAMGLIATEEEAAATLLAELADGREQSSRALPYGGEVAAVRLGTSTEARKQKVVLRDMRVIVPVSAFHALEETALVVASFDASNPDVLALSSSSKVVGSAVLTLRSLATEQELPISALREPISFTLPVNFSAGMGCAFWDEGLGEWSTRGVRTSVTNVVGEPVWCETTHLSLFGALMKGAAETLRCANFGLLNARALRQVLVGDWYLCRGSLLFAGLLLLLALVAIGSAALDTSRARHFYWRDELFLAMPPGEEVPEEGDSPASPPTPGMNPLTPGSTYYSSTYSSESDGGEDHAGTATAIPLMGCSSLCCGCSCCALAHDRSRVVFLGAVEAIFSSWFAYFGEVKAFLIECGSALNPDVAGLATGLTFGRMAAVSHRATASVLMYASRREAAVSLGLSEDTVGCVARDKSLVGFLMEDHAAGARTGAGRIASPDMNSGASVGSVGSGGTMASFAQDAWRTHAGQRALWQHLRLMVTDTLLDSSKKQGQRPSLGGVCTTVASRNPVAQLFVVDIFKSCKQRALLLAVELLGSSLFCCLFFESIGLVRGKRSRGCGSDHDGSIGANVGRFLVVSIASLIVAGLPVAFMKSVQTKTFTQISAGPPSSVWERQRLLRIWRMQEKMFWAFGCIYVGLCIVYIVLFLSNVSEEDHADFSIANTLTLLQELMMLPFLSSLLVPLAARSLLFVHATMNRINPQDFVRQTCLTLHRRVMMPIEEI